MIAILKGRVEEVDINSIVLDCGGVGYELRVTGTDHSLLHTGSEAKVFVYEHIKEDAHDLYGFLSKQAKHLFQQLLSVKNVGPKVAMAILDIDSVDGVKSAIASGEIKILQSAKGVGKRAAEQIVVELRDKLGVVGGEGADSVISRGSVQESDEAMQALLALGFNEADAITALSQVDHKLSTEDRVKLALRGGR
jgi:holliday junction DNA helicase RuvA